MSMPKGFKATNGYATVISDHGGLDYRTIAEKMTTCGDKMNHATARNIFLRAMEKFATSVYDLYDVPIDNKVIFKTVRDPRFQESMIELVTDIYEESDGQIDV